MRRMRMVLIVCAVLSALAVQCLAVAPSVEKIGKNAKIDWTNLVYVATGEGAIPSRKEEPNRARARLKAKDYATAAALANLLMAVQGTTVSYDSVGKDYMANTTVRQKIEGFVNNAKVTRTWDEKYEGDTIVVVEVRAPMFSNGGPGNVFVQEEAGERASAEPAAAVTVVSKPDRSVNVLPKAAAPSVSKPYTGLIIDCRGYKLDRCMSPKIRTSDGDEVWGTVKADPDTVIERGIVSYTTNLIDARKNPRAGANPLVIRATGRAGGRFYSDPVISDADAELLIAEDAKGGFLDKFNVVFIKDPAL